MIRMLNDELKWRESSLSSGGDNCVEVAWCKSSFSGLGECVEVKKEDAEVLLRDSKDPDGPVLAFTRSEMLAWVQGCKNGEFDDLC